MMGFADAQPILRPRPRRTALFDGDGRGFRRRKPVVPAPFELELAALGRDRRERQEGVGGDRREQLGAENLLSVIGADEQIDDVARQHIAGAVGAVAGLHHMGDQRLDLDDVAALGLGRNVDERAGHGQIPSRQAASVTTTSASSDQNEPSLSSATAITFCESASRMRVEMLALPARGPRWTLTTFGCGFFSLKTWIALTWSAAVIGLSTETVSGTVLPFSISGARSSVTLPLRRGASPRTFFIAACIFSGVARAGPVAATEMRPSPPARRAASIRKRRRVARGPQSSSLMAVS